MYEYTSDNVLFTILLSWYDCQVVLY